MNITILGTGAYGIALSSLINDKHNITMYTNSTIEVEELNTKRTNYKALKNYKIKDNIIVTNDLKNSIINSDIIIIAIPSQFINDTMKKIKKYYTNQYIILASKGIDNNNLLSEVIAKHISIDKLSIISGPSFANDIIKKCPSGLTLSCNSKYKQTIINIFNQERLIIEYCNDSIGVQICGSIKNVVAIGSGIINGLGFPDSTQALLITKAVDEVKTLIKELGGNDKTILTYSGIGDLILTCTSNKSRNYTLGKIIGTEKSPATINEYIASNTIEGLYSLKSIYLIIKKRNINIPLIKVLYDIVYKFKNPNIIIDYLTK